MISPRIGSFIGIFLIFIPNVCTLSNETTYVGCYDATIATSYSYTTVVKPLISLEICAKLCITQLTVYAGIVAKNFTCFCGNEIAELLTPTEDSRCDSCHEDPTKFCGGSSTVSLYRLRIKNKTPTTVLLATKQGIEIYQDSSSFVGNGQKYHFEEFNSFSSDATSLDYHFRKQEIYYASSKKIFKVAYIPVLMKFHHPMLVIETTCSSIVDLALDWVQEKLYWICSGTTKIFSVNLDRSDIQETLSNLYDLQHIAVEPFTQSIFSDSQRKLTVYNFTVVVKDVLQYYLFRETLQIAIDIQQETVYAIGSYVSGSSKKYLVSTNYDGTVFKVIYSGLELSNPFSLDVSNGTVIWGSKSSTDYILYKGMVSSRCELENLTIIYSGRNVIKDLKIYGPAVQSPSSRYLCKNKNCSYGCSVISPSFVQCSCPESMLLSDDRRTCDELVTKSVSTTTEQPNATEIITLSQFNKTADLIVPTKSSVELRLQDNEYYIRLFYIIGSVCLAIFVTMVIFHVYIYVMVKKSKDNFTLYYNKQSGLIELTHTEPKTGTCNLYS